MRRILTSKQDGRPVRVAGTVSYSTVLMPATSQGCDECVAWARLKIERKLPVAGDTYCGKCGAREADVTLAIAAQGGRLLRID